MGVFLMGETMFKEFIGTLTSKPDKLVEAGRGLLSNPLYLVFLGLLVLGFIGLLSLKKIKLETRTMTQIAALLAVATVLNMMIVYRLPQGGSVTLASMVPIYFLALAYGPGIGMLAGMLFGIIDLFLGASIYHPLQVLLDYPLAFMFIGLVALFPKRVNLGMLVATSMRLLCHVLSGYIFFGIYAPEGTHPLIYSFIYNASFLGVDLLIAALVMNFMSVNRLLKSLNRQAEDIKMW